MKHPLRRGPKRSPPSFVNCSMTRRRFLQSGAALAASNPLLPLLARERMDDAVAILERAVAQGQVAAAVLHVVQPGKSFARAFGKAATEEAMFLLGSISKPVSVTALMTLFDRGEFKLDDPVKKFIPQFKGELREAVTL